MEVAELAAMVDTFHRTRQERLEADKIASALKKKENDLKAGIIQELQRQEVDVVGGKELTVTLVIEKKPSVSNWGIFYNYIRETGQFDLLHRRVAVTAVKERWEQNVYVPGVTEIAVPNLSLSTVRRT